MTTHSDEEERSKKRFKANSEAHVTTAVGVEQPLLSFVRNVSPPISARKANDDGLCGNVNIQRDVLDLGSSGDVGSSTHRRTVVRSPFQLTRIRDLPDSYNVGTVTLYDILGDPLIKECWNFNFCFDLDYVMQAFDADVRNIVKVFIVHGFWKRDSQSRIQLEADVLRYPKVELRRAPMPEMYGTHHTKMIILFRHDNFAQVVIHTANMLAQDWTNMTQAVWRSPLLPRNSDVTYYPPEGKVQHALGTGERFKLDLIRYLKAYGAQTYNLYTQLQRYDFTAIRGAFVSSTPSRVDADQPTAGYTAWGLRGLERLLSGITCATDSGQGSSRGSTSRLSSNTPKERANHIDHAGPMVVAQISSIATLGSTDAWLQNFARVLSGCADTSGSEVGTRNPAFRIVFPTVFDVQSSLDSEVSGGSIHMKISDTATSKKQLHYLKPFLCRWNKATLDRRTIERAPVVLQSPAEQTYNALRGFAAPHIKTYVRYGRIRSPNGVRTIDWALVTSANLSTQAWGALPGKDGQVRVSSWEAGVLIWPALWDDLPEDDIGAAADKTSTRKAVIIPVFGDDYPAQGNHEQLGAGTLVGFRMPYDLPLAPYRSNEMPWSPSCFLA